MRRGNERIVVILHGLEGNASRKYVLGMVHIFNGAGFDTVSMNFRVVVAESRIKTCVFTTVVKWEDPHAVPNTWYR